LEEKNLSRNLGVVEIAENADQKAGKHAGRRWALAKNGAGVQAINRLTKAHQVWDEWFWRAETSYTPSQSVYFVINPSDDGDRREARSFWECWANDPDPSRDFVEGFVNGALEAWDEVGARG